MSAPLAATRCIARDDVRLVYGDFLIYGTIIKADVVCSTLGNYGLNRARGAAVGDRVAE